MDESLKKRYSSVLESLKKTSARPVTLIAVSKTQPVENIVELYHLGQREFGENYVQELIDKAKYFKDHGYSDVRFHFIGHLQTNKVKKLIPWVCAIQSVDSFKLLGEIDKQAKQLNIKVPCYFQINIDREATKSGFDVQEISVLAEKIKEYPNVLPTGFMIIPDPGRPLEQAFNKISELSEQFKPTLGAECSMGMSDDFLLAIQHGATVVRVGSLIFGPRK